ncbi:hypothetical protein H0H87_007575 [Tephrocybe sp. NHM501043]|nr:hypothetical protein H0H87_007575 [Tephrocybe sp. NHM501043]
MDLGQPVNKSYSKPGVFSVGYASSAVVEAILDFWEYFEPIRLNMPQNCSADVQAVIGHIDEVFSGTNTTAIQAIKDNFGLGGMTHLDDVAGALRNNLWDWQSLSVTTGPGGQFFKFCDALEVNNGKIAPASGWGLDHAFAAWGAYWRNTYLTQLCGSLSAEDCLGTYDATQAYYTDTDVDNANRSWFWIVCNEVGYLQDGAPTGQPSLVTRLVQPAYDLRQCQLMFPGAFTQTVNVQVDRTNELYDGWNVSIDHLFFANGIRDPWKDATVSAAAVNIPSTSLQPIAVGDGFHCSDLLTASGTVDATILAVQVKALESIKMWLTTWTPHVKSSGTPAKKSVAIAASQVPRQHLAKPISAFNKG